MQASWSSEERLDVRVESRDQSGIALQFEVVLTDDGIQRVGVAGRWRRDAHRVDEPREGPIEEVSGLLRYRLESRPGQRTLVALYSVRCKVRGAPELVMGGWNLELPPR